MSNFSTSSRVRKKLSIFGVDFHLKLELTAFGAGAHKSFSYRARMCRTFKRLDLFRIRIKPTLHALIEISVHMPTEDPRKAK